MTDIARLRRELIERILGSAGTAPKDLRENAFNNIGRDGPVRTLVAKVAHHSDAVTDADIAAVELPEDQIFEIIVCAAVGQADRQYTAALDALTRATGGHR